MKIFNNKLVIIFIILLIVLSGIIQIYVKNTLYNNNINMQKNQLVNTERYLFKNLSDLQNFGILLSQREDLLCQQKNNNVNWIEDNIFQSFLNIEGNYVIGIMTRQTTDIPTVDIVYKNKLLINQIINELSYKINEIKNDLNYPYVDYICYENHQYQVYLSIITDTFGGGYDKNNLSFIIILKEIDQIFFKQLNYLTNNEIQIQFKDSTIKSSNFNIKDEKNILKIKKDSYISVYYDNISKIIYQKKDILSLNGDYLFSLIIKTNQLYDSEVITIYLCVIFPLLQILINLIFYFIYLKTHNNKNNIINNINNDILNLKDKK